jgi:glycosyltransferase involved in cell wall biosynthesis
MISILENLMRRICINTRVLGQEITGLQRYTNAIVSRIGDGVRKISPSSSCGMIKGNLWEQFVLPKQLRREDVLFSPANTGPLGLARQVVTIHDVVPLDRPEWFDAKKGSWYRFLTPRLVQSAAHVITISEFSKQRLLAQVPLDENRITVIANGVDEMFRMHTVTELAPAMDALGLTGRRYVLSVGTLEPRKNVTRLLKAWSRIVDLVEEDILLVLTGKQEDANSFAQAAGFKELPARVCMTGHVSDELIAPLYAGAMVFVFPSMYEGFGLPPLEAMASGVPVLAGNLSSLPEVIGDAGLIVDPCDTDAIAGGLLRILRDEGLRHSLKALGLDRAKLFSWDISVNKTWSVLQSVAES